MKKRISLTPSDIEALLFGLEYFDTFDPVFADFFVLETSTIENKLVFGQTSFTPREWDIIHTCILGMASVIQGKHKIDPDLYHETMQYVFNINKLQNALKDLKAPYFPTPQKPEKLSENAWIILQAIKKHHIDTAEEDFSDFDAFPFSRDELERCFQELHDQRYVFWERRGMPDEYLYILFDAISDCTPCFD